MPAENRKIDDLLFVMEDFEKTQIDLQREDVTLSNIRDNFAEVMKAYSSMELMLKPDAKIVHDPEFEEVIVMIQSGKKIQLTLNQLKTVDKLFTTSYSSNLEKTENLSLLYRALKRRMLRETSFFDRYRDTRFILPTFDVCERMFSLT